MLCCCVGFPALIYRQPRSSCFFPTAPAPQACGWRLRWWERPSRAAAWQRRCSLGRATTSSPPPDPAHHGPSSLVSFLPALVLLLAATVGQRLVVVGGALRQRCGPAREHGCLLSHANLQMPCPPCCLPIPLPTPIWRAAVELGSKERMVAFCRAVQKCCPIGSYISPEPGARQQAAQPATAAASSSGSSLEQRRQQRQQQQGSRAADAAGSGRQRQSAAALAAASIRALPVCADPLTITPLLARRALQASPLATAAR